jgi:CubicO group peptidase (beta-lactamase class C family)
MHDLQRQVQDAIDQLVSSGAERGLQVAVYRHGDQVVDAVAGVADPATGRPVTPDTPIYSYSVGKGVTATVAHVLAERRLFGYDTPIVELWPEFGAHGKETASVRHALTHSVGVPALPADTTVEDVCDWQKMCAVIADAEPRWEPGSKTGYHAYTFGYIIGEVVRRASTTSTRPSATGRCGDWGTGSAVQEPTRRQARPRSGWRAPAAATATPTPPPGSRSP